MGGVTNFIDVGGAKALLHRGEPVGRRRFLAQEKRDHLLHTGGRQQDRRIITRYERGAWHACVPTLLKETQKCFSYLGALQAPALCRLAGAGSRRIRFEIASQASFALVTN